MTALAPPKGADGDLNKFREHSSHHRGWNAPLPAAVPLSLYSLPFPRDRVNPSVLRELPPLTLTGPVLRKGHLILEMEDAGAFEKPEELFRSIHGKEAPTAVEGSFINWKGLLLAPDYTSFVQEFLPDDIENIRFHYRTWQLGLYKIRLDRTRLWWEDFSWTCLWQVRKAGT